MDWTAIYPFWSAGIVSTWADATRRAVSRILLSDRFPGRICFGAMNGLSKATIWHRWRG